MSASRLLVALAIAGAVAIPSALAGGGPKTPTSATPPALTGYRTLQHSPARVRWVFRERDLVTCRTPATLLRHLRARFSPDELEFAAIAVGMSQERAETFFRAERLDFAVQAVDDEAGLYALSPGTPPPGLYFMLGDSVVASFRAAEIGRYPELSEVEPVLPRLLPQAALAENIPFPLP